MVPFSGMPIIFYDLETFGLSPSVDRIAEFAGIVTDDALELLEQPWELRCVPPSDYLATPEACLTTGITPQMALQTGLPEPDFASKLHHWFTARSETLILGYNNVNFDDEFVRHLFYRTFLDPYGWHFRNGNRRMDMLAVMPAIFDFHRETLVWPRTETGAPDFRLEALSAINNALGGTSHEALADTFALRNVTKLIQERIPDVWNALPTLLDKKVIEQRLERAFRNGPDAVTADPSATVVYSSPRLRNEMRASSFFLVLGRESGPAGQWWLLDLAGPTDDILDISPEDVFARWYTRDRPECFRRLHRINPRRFPCILPVRERQVERMEELGLPWDRVRIHLERSREVGVAGWARRLVSLFSPGNEPEAVERDVDGRLYDGFIPDGDRARVVGLEEAGTADIARVLKETPFQDDRYRLLAERFVGRYTPGRLSAEERRAFRADAAHRIDVPRFDESWRRAVIAPTGTSLTAARKQRVLQDLKDHRNSVVRRMEMERLYGILE
jgi:exodeoxyribonuclease I